MAMSLFDLLIIVLVTLMLLYYIMLIKRLKTIFVAHPAVCKRLCLWLCGVFGILLAGLLVICLLLVFF